MNSAQLESLAESLSGQARGEGYMCKCPGHDDRKQSLSIKIGDNGKLVAHCFAGCTWEKLQPLLQHFYKQHTSNVVSFPATTKGKKKIIAEYIYRDEQGAELFRKLRYEDKSFRFKHGNLWNLKSLGRPVPLYGIERLAEVKNATIILCEGEKDVDSLVALDVMSEGFVPVTNHNGATSWSDDFSKQISTFQGVIILEDNDEAGRKRTASLLRSLKNTDIKVDRYTDMFEKGDVSDWLALGHTKQELFERWIRLEMVARQDSAQEESGDRRPATRQDYYELFTDVLGELRRDIFSGSLLYLDNEQKSWQPAINEVGRLRAEMVERARERGLKFSRSDVKDFLQEFQSAQPLVLIPEIPTWDGRDYISEWCSYVVIDESKGISGDIFEAIIKQWIAGIFIRLKDASHRQFMPVLLGAQEIGKDYWIDSGLMALGQWFKNLHVFKGDKDIYLACAKACVINISEFDRTARTEVSLLKDLITTSHSDIRGSYEAEERRRVHRCSFISSCNVDDILRDSTGNSRYVLFNVTGFRRERYKKDLDFSRGIMAQGQALAEQGFKAPGEAWDVVRGIVADMTPGSIEDEIAELWEDLAAGYVEGLNLEMRDVVEKYGWIRVADCSGVLGKMTTLTGHRLRYIQRALKIKGYGYRNGITRGYYVTKARALGSGARSNHITTNVEDDDEPIF